MKLSVLTAILSCIHIASKATAAHATDDYHSDTTCRKSLHLNARVVPLDLNASRDTNNADEDATPVNGNDEDEVVDDGRGGQNSSSHKNDDGEDNNRHQTLSCYEPPFKHEALLAICEMIEGGTMEERGARRGDEFN
jgi:hypothetical protein